MTENQEKHLKRLNGFYAKLFQEMDYKGALSVSKEIEAFTSKIEAIEAGLKRKEQSPLH